MAEAVIIPKWVLTYPYQPVQLTTWQAGDIHYLVGNFQQNQNAGFTYDPRGVDPPGRYSPTQLGLAQRLYLVNEGYTKPAAGGTAMIPDESRVGLARAEAKAGTAGTATSGSQPADDNGNRSAAGIIVLVFLAVGAALAFAFAG